MNKTVTLTIDGSTIRAPEGGNVLDAALEYGICIPHLCHMRDLLPSGACRLCIVELEQHGRTQVAASCTLEAREGMIIHAHSKQALRLRRNIAEMLVAEAPNSRAIQDMAVRCGVKSVRYPFRRQDCVLCGRCVRVCSEVWQSRSLGFVGRGRDRHVALPFDQRPEFCKRCNACIMVCPMTVTPCDGPMPEGREYLCGKCESQLMITQESPQSCVWCRLGRGFSCSRQMAAARQ